ncbi:kinase-like domain-containing protein [Microdochium bolleyi]|uniref:Kinase-like domain-containing protein n=1 Tax=Microdochium bolleyi TaxID=196109 RepID=A0A136JGD7_9PEZI|nr:kinase-like domain-containing protein [Microdochium bolleyi]
MGDVFPSEERTEPFTAEELELRLSESIRVEDLEDLHDDQVPLDSLVVDEDHHKKGIRILVRPLTRSRSVSPGNDNCQWLALRAEIADPKQPKSTVLAVTQTSKDISFSIRIPGDAEDEDRPPLWCELYYDPASDSLILYNKSDNPIVLARRSQTEAGSPTFGQQIVPWTTQELLPGTWRISMHSKPMLDFRILERRPATLRIPRDDSDLSSVVSSSHVLNSSVKRSFSEDDLSAANASIEKRLRMNDSLVDDKAGQKDEDGVIIFLGPRDESLVFPLPHATRTKEVAIPHGHALLEIQKDDTVSIPGGCELDEYQLTKRSQIATTAASSVFTADYSHAPEGVITVKVLKTQNPNATPVDNHRNVIRQADIWLREYKSQEDLKHESIVKLYGGDARYLSLYMEHVDGKDLAARGVWRDSRSDLFVGTRADALRILRDISSALHYVHLKNKVHNDIKPANILYSKDRGAVLCDFGLSTRKADPATNGGTPYYIPPEFIGQKLRGPASDVWALGVTMLYVLRKVAFPDARGRQGHPRQLYWMIADLNRKSHHSHHARGQPSAISQMQQWLLEVKDAKARLDPRDKLESLVAQMLTPNPNQRITMAKVISELTASSRPRTEAVPRQLAVPAAPARTSAPSASRRIATVARPS